MRKVFVSLGCLFPWIWIFIKFSIVRERCGMALEDTEERKEKKVVQYFHIHNNSKLTTFLLCNFSLFFFFFRVEQFLSDELGELWFHSSWKLFTSPKCTAQLTNLTHFHALYFALWTGNFSLRANWVLASNWLWNFSEGTKVLARSAFASVASSLEDDNKIRLPRSARGTFHFSTRGVYVNVRWGMKRMILPCRWEKLRS